MKLNLANLNNAIASALFETNQILSQSAQKQLKTRRWKWDRVTKRRSGEVVFTPRDIVDTGALYRSMSRYSTDRSATIRYSARHAAIVHRRRPWLRTALNESNVLSIFAQKLRNKL